MYSIDPLALRALPPRGEKISMLYYVSNRSVSFSSPKGEVPPRLGGGGGV